MVMIIITYNRNELMCWRWGFRVIILNSTIILSVILAYVLLSKNGRGFIILLPTLLLKPLSQWRWRWWSLQVNLKHLISLKHIKRSQTCSSRKSNLWLVSFRWLGHSRESTHCLRNCKCGKIRVSCKVLLSCVWSRFWIWVWRNVGNDYRACRIVLLVYSKLRALGIWWLGLSV